MLNDVEFCESLLLVLSRWLIRPIGRLYEAFLQLLSIIQHDHCRRDDHDNHRRDNHCQMKDKRQKREKQSRWRVEEGTVQSLTLLNVFFVNSLALYGDHQQWLRYLWKIFRSKLKGAWRLLTMEAANPGGQLDETPGNHTSHPDTKFSTRLFAWWLPWSWGTKPLQFPVRKFPR